MGLNRNGFPLLVRKACPQGAGGGEQNSQEFLVYYGSKVDLLNRMDHVMQVGYAWTMRHIPRQECYGVWAKKAGFFFPFLPSAMLEDCHQKEMHLSLPSNLIALLFYQGVLFFA